MLKTWTWATLIATAILMWAASATLAAADGPKNTGALAALCSSNFSACRTAITDAQFDLTVEALSDKTKKLCGVPEGISPEQGARAIAGWLAGHPESYGLPTEDGVAAAMKGVWQCAAKINTGLTSSGVPDTTGRFVTFCADKANYVKCANESIEGGLNATAEIIINDSSKHCELPKGIKTPEVYDKVITWLIAHPETYKLETDEGIAVATDAVWPCRKK